MALEQVFVLHRGMSSGLAVLAKHPLGLRRQMSYAIMKGKHRLSEPSKSRLIGVLVDVSGWKAPLGTASIYMNPSDGQGYFNQAIQMDYAAMMGAHMGSTCADIIAGDRNDAPKQTCMRVMVPAHQNMGPIAPPCITAQSVSKIDRVMASKDRAQINKGLYTNSEYHEGPHKPVTCVFRSDAHRCTRFVATKQINIPTSRPYGPHTPPVYWDGATQLAVEALEAAQEATLQQARKAMQVAYASGANTAEQELADATGTGLGNKEGKRGNVPKLQEQIKEAAQSQAKAQ